METTTLNVKKRETAQRQDMGSGMIPAVLYGKGFSSQTLWIDSKQFDKIHREAGESSIIDLVVSDKDNKKTEKVLIYDLQQDPVSDKIIHVDFYRVRMDEVIETDVNLKFVGEAPAVKELGGVLVRNVDEVEVKCLPVDLPKEIIVDIASLKTFEDHIYIKDLDISEKVTINADPETLVALVTPPRSQEEIDELETEVEADITQVEGMKDEQEGELSAEEDQKKEQPKAEE